MSSQPLAYVSHDMDHSPVIPAMMIEDLWRPMGQLPDLSNMFNVTKLTARLHSLVMTYDHISKR